MYLHFSILMGPLASALLSAGSAMLLESRLDLAEPPWKLYITYASRLAAKEFISVKDIGYAHDRA